MCEEMFFSLLVSVSLFVCFLFVWVCAIFFQTSWKHSKYWLLPRKKTFPISSNVNIEFHSKLPRARWIIIEIRNLLDKKTSFKCMTFCMKCWKLLITRHRPTHTHRYILLDEVIKNNVIKTDRERESTFYQHHCFESAAFWLCAVN